SRGRLQSETATHVLLVKRNRHHLIRRIVRRGKPAKACSKSARPATRLTTLGLAPGQVATDGRRRPWQRSHIERLPPHVTQTGQRCVDLARGDAVPWIALRPMRSPSSHSVALALLVTLPARLPIALHVLVVGPLGRGWRIRSGVGETPVGDLG